MTRVVGTHSGPAGTIPPEGADHVLVNGLSIGSGGGYTVARELTRNLALVRPGWRFTLLLIDADPLHSEMRTEHWPANCQLHFAPPQTAKRMARGSYERNQLTRWASQQNVSAVIQLNGMIVPGMPAPSLCHFQDPWPYRPEAWSGGMRDRVLALLKRRAHAQALKGAAACGFTSEYLKDLILHAQGIRPARAAVFYNGIPDDWVARARQPQPPLGDRPMQIVTISNVSRYKRQSLVIRALAQLAGEPGLEPLSYRIAGDCPPPMRVELTALADSLGVADRVHIEGRVTDQCVKELLAGSRAFVTMSVCESFGIPMVEAMSFGTPVIAADCCALPEVGGDAVELSPVDDVSALATRLKNILTDASHAQALAERGTARVPHFQWKTTAMQMAEVLDAMPAQRGRY